MSNKRTLIGLAIGHGAHDTWYGVAPILLASLSGEMALSNAAIAQILLLYQLLSSFTQPFFGRLSEKIGGRPLAVISIIWTTCMFSIALFVNTTWALSLCIFLAGLGSGAFHPQAAANATAAGGQRYGATAMSLFFLGGTGGSALLGAALGGYLIENFGRTSLLVISATTILIALTVVRSSTPRTMPVLADATKENKIASKGKVLWIPVALLLLVMAVRGLSQNAITTFVPKFQEDMGVAASVYGLLMSMYMIANALGGVLGSFLADRLDFRTILTGAIIGSGLLLWGSNVTTGFASQALFVLSGFIMGPAHTLLIRTGQRRFPSSLATASGFFMGFTFVTSAGGAWLLGLLADQRSLSLVMQMLPWLMLISGVLVIPAIWDIKPKSAQAVTE